MQVLSNFIGKLVDLIIQPLVGLLFALALAFFVYGAAMFILNAGDSEARKKGKDALIWGLIGLFIMSSVWGILNVLTNTFF